eukprot:TRINITY_DN10128_c0_g1_i1.p1 TRINITY_DN10128_c0_g1~~TRINITY_DN10128_c0_g1_i1.p1  ORF type:complete len:664 (-),score=157.57 TRINITY_DN10128_c0_g1_i1:50-1759(-)
MSSGRLVLAGSSKSRLSRKKDTKQAKNKTTRRTKTKNGVGKKRKKKQLSPSSKRPRLSTENNNDLWVDKYRPSKMSQLAVAKKKIQTLSSLILDAFSGKLRMIIITGPSGAGKTAALEMIGKDMEYSLISWRNPERHMYKNIDLETRDYVPVMEPFRNFILHQKYPELTLRNVDSAKKLILIEDMPYLFGDSQKIEFLNLIRETIMSSSVHPIVFIISDDSKGNSPLFKIFSSDIVQHEKVSQIRFNPVNATNMRNIFRKIIKKENINVSDNQLEELIEKSDGDIRNGINTLQFHTKTSDSENHRNYKDKDYSLFHSVGKILYNKRLEDNNTPLENRGPTYRAPMKSDPADLLGHVSIDIRLFNQYLHQNYIKFFGDIGEAADALEYLSDSADISSDWVHRKTLDDYAWSISCRGILYTNQEKPRNSYTPIYRPGNRSADTRANYNQQLIKNIFTSLPESMYPPQISDITTLQTEIIPYVAKFQHYGAHSIGRNIDTYIKQMNTYNTGVTRGERVADSSFSDKNSIKREYDRFQILKRNVGKEITRFKSNNEKYNDILAEDDIEEFSDE